MTVRELLCRMDSAELSEWEAYYGIDPFGLQREDMRFAMLVSGMCGMVGKKTRIQDFMLYPEKYTREDTPAQMLTKLKGFAEAMRTFGGNGHRVS